VILQDYLGKNDIIALLRVHADRVDGTKDRLIRRLQSNTVFDPKEVLQYLNKWQLSELCRLRGKEDSGDRESLELRLSEVLQSEGRSPSEESRGPPGGPGADWWALIHPTVRRVAESRINAGHFADAVEAALKEVNVRVKTYVRTKKGEERDGKDLMMFAFSPRDPVIRLGSQETMSGRDEQEGYMFIFAGAMQAIRNPKAHENEVIDQSRALHHLALASLLMQKLDEAGIR
jgi:uncharacterized protein (TIGR02391 family)